MKVVITGANSAVGQAIFRCVRRAGASPDTFIAAVRSSRAEEQLRSQIGDLDGVLRISYDDPASLDAAFRGACSVVHLAGILIEQPHSTYEDANVGSTRSVVEGAKRNKVEKLTLVSAIGADENSRNRYYRTKGQAEALVRESGLCYTILRVPILLGPATAGAAALKHQLKVGRARLIDGGLHQQQPLHVDDLARAAMVVASRLSVARETTLELVGPCSLSERDLVERTARSLGRTIRIRAIPKRLISVALAIRERVAGRGFSRDALDVITADTRVPSQPAARELGIELTGIDQMIQDSLG
jgi:NADH dehydrogenase